MNTPDTPDQMVSHVAGNPLFQGVDRSLLEPLKPKLNEVRLSKGDVLFQEGDPVDSMYFLVDGCLQVVKRQDEGREVVLAALNPGDTIGELQILTGGARTATVIADSNCHLVRLCRDGFHGLLADNPDLVARLSETITPRVFRTQMVAVLPKLFGTLNGDLIRQIEQRMTWRHVRRGSILFKQGDPSDCCFLIISGRLQVAIRGSNGAERVVGEMLAGEIVGEMGLFTGDQRSATIVAARDSELLEFTREKFVELTHLVPQILDHIIHRLAMRLQKAHGHQSQVASTNLAIVPAGEDRPLDDFARKFASILERSASCLLISSRIVDECIGVPGIAQAGENDPSDLRLRCWLGEQENKYRFVLYQADATVTNWTKRCIHQADEVLYVADATSCPDQLSQSEYAVDQQGKEHHTQSKRWLILTHPDDFTQARGTFEWLKRRNVIRHFHIRPAQDADWERVTRFVAGQAVGLVLSGGGARGFAHIGIIRACHELGIPIDFIGGVSMGAIVSSMYACREDFMQATIEFRQAVKRGPFDYTLPLLSIARGARFDNIMRAIVGEQQIEDLWTPFFSVSSNLTQADIVVHRTGPVWRAARSSGSLPGILSPVIQNGELLYDGCLLNNLPMDVMRKEVGNGTVIAVDVVPPVDLNSKYTNLQSPSGWGLLWSRINPLAQKVRMPTIVAVMQRAGELGSVYGRQKLIDAGLADLYMRPAVEHIAILDFTRLDEAIEVGYRGGVEQLREWWPRRRGAAVHASS